MMNVKINDYENIIKEKDNIIFELKEKIKKLESKLNEKLTIEKDNNFDINSQKSFNTLNFHSNTVSCLAILNDGRLVSGSLDNNIIIYNRETYQPDIIIKEHKSPIYHITQLSNGILASCSQDQTMILYNINGNNYENFQTLNEHKEEVFKIIELKNKNLVSCSQDKSSIFYSKNKSKYKKDYKFSTYGGIRYLIQSKDNEICFSSIYYDTKLRCDIRFYDFNKKKINSILKPFNFNSYTFRTFNMITKDLLVAGGINKIYIINVNNYTLDREIEIINTSIFGFCMIDENIFITGDNNGTIIQWKIEEII